jgi:hypothetical protein
MTLRRMTQLGHCRLVCALAICPPLAGGDPVDEQAWSTRDSATLGHATPPAGAGPTSRIDKRCVPDMGLVSGL